MARRLGLKSMRTLAVKICQLYTTFYPVILQIYGTLAPQLVVAVEAVNVACATLVLEIDKVIDVDPNG